MCEVAGECLPVVPANEQQWERETVMTETAKTSIRQRSLLHLAEVKDQLAAKYARLAKSVSSKVRRRIYLNRVKKFTLQARNARIMAERVSQG